MIITNLNIAKIERVSGVVKFLKFSDHLATSLYTKTFSSILVFFVKAHLHSTNLT
jgi:hypothetical protein